MDLIDFHCDTPTALYRTGTPFAECRLAANPLDTAAFGAYLQCAACFLPPQTPDADGMAYADAVFDNLCARVAELPWGVIVSDRAALLAAVADGARAFLPTVEDMRLIGGDTRHIARLRARGVRIGTLTWRGVSAIGGAWDTDVGLTPLGRETVAAMLEAGILPDVSHASCRTFDDVAALCHEAGRPFVATHSNAFALCPHPRNLDDAQLRAIADAGGVVGLNLYPPFLRVGGDATLADAVAHAAHLASVIGSENVVLGTDFDGTDALPCGIRSVADLPKLAEALADGGLSPATVDGIFYQNGKRFLLENI